MASADSNTGTQDTTYNLVSIIYHALQGAETYDAYISDADKAGQQELSQFFSEVRDENTRRAQRAQALLVKHLSQQQSGGQTQQAQSAAQ